MKVKQFRRLLAKEKKLARDPDFENLDLLVYDWTDPDHERILDIEEIELDGICEWDLSEEGKTECSHCGFREEVIALTISDRSGRIRKISKLKER